MTEEIERQEPKLRHPGGMQLGGASAWSDVQCVRRSLIVSTTGLPRRGAVGVKAGGPVHSVEAIRSNRHRLPPSYQISTAHSAKRTCHP